MTNATECSLHQTVAPREFIAAQRKGLVNRSGQQPYRMDETGVGPHDQQGHTLLRRLGSRQRLPRPVAATPNDRRPVRLFKRLLILRHHGLRMALCALTYSPRSGFRKDLAAGSLADQPG